MEQPDQAAARESEETLFGGYFLSAAFLSNPTFAARPDNTGLVGLRHMLHLETDLYKQYLTFYTDQNFFSDRTKGWIELSEWDGTVAVTGLVDRFGWRIQYERDAPLDKSGLKRVYADTLLTSRFQVTEDVSWWKGIFPNQNLNPRVRKVRSSVALNDEVELCATNEKKGHDGLHYSCPRGLGWSHQHARWIRP